jgi:hypothetical protein
VKETMVTYDTLIDTTQEAVYGIINTDSTIATYTSNIVDGLPYTKMQRGTGFPYVKIPSPTAEEERYTFTKSKVTMVVEITIYSTVASVLREVTDAVRKALTENQNVTQGVKLFDRKLPVTDYNESLLDNDKPMYENTVTATYMFIGEING